MKKLIFIILCLAFICCPGFFAAATDDDGGEDSDIVYDLEELEYWLNEHWRTGGTVYLGDDIAITGNCDFDVNMYAGSEIIVETGQYGFIVTGIMSIGSNIRITGDGTRTPVILVRSGGAVYIAWCEFEDMALLTVTGAGGTGLKLENGARYSAGLLSFMRYRALGPESVAIDSDVELELHDHYIEASGAGARGIASDAQVDMLLSCITSDGASISAPSVTLDTCIVSPEVAGANVINRRISYIGPSFYPHDPIPAGSGYSGFFGEIDMFCVILLSAEGLEDVDLYGYVFFDDSSVDYDTPGRYYLPPILPLPAPYDIFDFNYGEVPATYAVTVFDPDIPMFLDFYFALWTNEYIIRHIYLGNEFLTLWRSDDDGENWYVFWKQDDEPAEGFSVWTDYDDYIDLCICDKEILKTPAWFVYEVGTGKGSDVLYVDLNNMIVEECVGGDRDGGDRILRPWEFFTGGEGGEQGNSGNGGQNPIPNYYDDNPHNPGPVIIQGDPLISTGDGAADDDYLPLSEQPPEENLAFDSEAEQPPDAGALASELAAGDAAPRATAASRIPRIPEREEDLILESDNPIPLSTDPKSIEDIAAEEKTYADNEPTITGRDTDVAPLPGPATPVLPDAFMTGTGIAKQVEPGSQLIYMAIAAGVAGVGGGTGILLAVRKRMRRK